MSKENTKPLPEDEEQNTGASPEEHGDLALAPVVPPGVPVAGVQGESGAALARTKVTPRDEQDSYKRMLKLSTVEREAFFYRWPVRNRDGSSGVVQGATIEFALEAKRAFKNLMVETKCTGEDDDYLYFTGTVIDLETGDVTSRPFRQRKRYDMGDMKADRQGEQAFSIGASKCTRNVLLRGGLPNWFVKGALSMAIRATEYKKSGKNPKELVASISAADDPEVIDVDDIDTSGKVDAKVVRALLDQFSKMEVTQAMLEAKLGVKRRAWQAREVVLVEGLLRALGDRQTTLQREFPELSGSQSAPQVTPKGTTPVREESHANTTPEELLGEVKALAKGLKVKADDVRKLAIDNQIDMDNLTDDTASKLMALLSNPPAKEPEIAGKDAEGIPIDKNGNRLL